MFLGHFGVGFAAKKAAPNVSLGALFLAGQFADLLWPTLVLVGVERLEVRPGISAVTPLEFVSYPYSHSLVALLGWALLLGSLVAVTSRAMLDGVTVAALVLSHWLLDFLTHRPDLPLTLSGTTRLGLGLWNSVPWTLAVELLVFTDGISLYVRTTASRDRAGSTGLYGLIVLLILMYVASVFGPPPPNAATVAWSAQAMWLLVLWAMWIDRHRAAEGPA
jgi:hypothetical protein